MGLHHRLVGKVAQLVWRITKPRTIGVRAVLLDQDDRVALVRHTYTDHWHLPGGGVKEGESVEAALFRELEEEVAVINPSIERVLGVYHNRREAKDDHIVIFAARTTSGASSSLKRADVIEIEEARWFRLDEIPPLRLPPRVGVSRNIDEVPQVLANGSSLAAAASCPPAYAFTQPLRDRAEAWTR